MKNKKYLDFILTRWKPYIKYAILITFLTALNTLIVLYYPYLLKYIINGLQENIQLSLLKKYVLLLILSGFGIAIVYSFLQQNRLRMNLIFSNTMREKIFYNFFNYKAEFFNQFESGDISARLVVDNESLSWFLSSGIFRGVEGLFLLLFGTYILIKINFILTIISILPLFLIIFALLITTEEKLRQKFRFVQNFVSKISNFIGTSFSGIILVKTKNRIPLFYKMLREMLMERKVKEIDAIKYERFVDLSYQTGITLSIALFLLFGGKIAISGKLPLGDFVAFISYLTILIEPMFMLGYFVISFARSKAYIDRLTELYNEELIEKSHRNVKKDNFEQELILNDVGYSLNGIDILKNISFSLKKGEKIAIVGDVGSGKTTLLKLILSILKPTQGKITLDNIELANINYSSLNKLFGYTPQDNLLFSTTIKENITFSNNKISDKRISDALNTSLFSKDMTEYHIKLEHKLGSEGKSISGGQKQRISLARALVEDHCIYIFDDITSSLDPETEHQLLNNIFTTLKDKTIIMVTYNLFALSKMDQIILLKNGKLLDLDNHLNLVKKSDYYKDLLLLK